MNFSVIGDFIHGFIRDFGVFSDDCFDGFCDDVGVFIGGFVGKFIAYLLVIVMD